MGSFRRCEDGREYGRQEGRRWRVVGGRRLGSFVSFRLVDSANGSSSDERRGEEAKE